MVLFIFFLTSSAWGFVGEGASVAPRASYSTNSPKVIVSRSHSGTVKKFAQTAFGNNTEIIPAGGAGTVFLEFLMSVEFRMYYDSNT